MTTDSARRPATPPHPQRRGARTPLSFAVLCMLAGAALAEPSATVLFASGEARVLSASGASREVKAGAVIESGESIETGKGKVQLRMVDGALMSINERTLLRLDDYHLAGSAGNDERGFMSLVRGGLRTVSGSIGKARVDNYKLDTPSGTIGIRGTEYTAVIDGGLRVGVLSGRVAVCNDGGCVDVPKGSSAVTTGRAVRPAVSQRVAIVIAPAGGHEIDRATVTAAAATPTAGDRVARYLETALSGTAVLTASSGSTPAAADDALPPVGALSPAAGGAATVADTSGLGTITPAPAPVTSATAPTPAPAPIVAPSPAPVPAPAPSPAADPITAPVTTSPPAVATPAPAPVTAPVASPAPVTAAPAPATAPVATPAPAPAVADTPVASPAPVSAPSPAATPAPVPLTAAVPLPNGSGTLGLVWSTDKGELGSGLTQGKAVFDANGGLVELTGATGSKIMEKGTAIDPGADGIVAWGRWVDGQSKVKDASGNGKGNLATLHYFAFEGSPTLPVVGAFSSFASTAPTVQSGGQLVATGVANGPTGALNVAFLSIIGGLATYNLSVPVAGQTFSLVGTATQTSQFGFAGGSLISSTGSACSGGCTGSLGSNNSVIGMIGGTSGNRVGVNYGFDSRIGNVSGVIVFKR